MTQHIRFLILWHNLSLINMTHIVWLITMVSETTLWMKYCRVLANLKFGVKESNLGGGLYGNFLWIWGIQYFIICGMILNDIKKFEPVNTSWDHDQEQYLYFKLKNSSSKNVTFSSMNVTVAPSRLMMTNVGTILKASLRTSESEIVSQRHASMIGDLLF